MAVPFTPEPTSRHSEAGDPSTSDVKAPVDGAATHAYFPATAEPSVEKPGSKSPAIDESSPTVISMARKTGPDIQHADSLVGRKLGHFELIQSVGVGGMAAVIKAQDLDLGRIVALKILPPDMAAEPENISRFKQEARSAARLDHENIARVYYCGEDQGLHYIAFEFVEGKNLRVRMEENGGRLPVPESLHYLIQVTAGLSHASSRGVVHRDIKPSNIIITPAGKAKIVDMGLARNLDTRASNGQLTQSGMTLGTFDYISPEQAIEPRSADCRSDIYSLGCTFYHVLTGRTPVPDGTAAKKLDFHQHQSPIDPRELNPAIPADVAAILGRMMAKDPSQRYQHPDHLLQHLLLVAGEMRIPGIPLNGQPTGALAYADRPLPPPPRLSPWLIAAAVVFGGIGLFAASGGFSNNRPPLDPPPFWQTEKTARELVAPSVHTNDKAINSRENPIPSKGQQEARNAQELVNLLRQPNAHIKLIAGEVYDLSKVATPGAELPEALFTGSNLVLECDRLIERKPIVRVRASAFDAGRIARPGSLSIRGPIDGSPAKVRLRGIRFEIVADELEQGAAGVSLLNIDQVDIEECSFVPPLQKSGVAQKGAAALAIHQSIAKNAPAEARLERCWFSPGSTAVDLLKTGGQSLRAVECAFGPQFTVVRANSQPDDLENSKPVNVTFQNCSLLMTRGSAVEIENEVPCRVAAGGCLFSSPEPVDEEAAPAHVIHQIGAIAPETRYEGLKSPAGAVLPNGYHQVTAFADAEHALSFEDCKKQMLPIDDAGARLLTKNPWSEEQPVKKLYDYPRQVKQVFCLDLKQEILRYEPDKNRNILGTQHLPGIRIYDIFPFSPLSETRLAGNIKVWQPGFATDVKLPPNTYRSLIKAIDDLDNGDTLVIRHNGLLEVDPVEFKKADTAFTIRPDDGFQPVLMPKAPTLKKETALFKLYGGQINLEKLHFRLKPDRAPAVVTLPGGAQCTFRNCSITLEESDELCVASLADPRGEMMMMGMMSPEKWPTPRIYLENTFVRGRGRLLAVHGSRPFDLRMKNDLVVLDGSLIGVDASSIDLPELSPAQVSLDHVTTYLTRNLIAQKAADRRSETRGLGLVQVQVQAANSLFVPAADQAALVFLDRVDSSEQMETVFQWRDPHRNIYGFKPDQVLLQIAPEDMDTVMLLERVGRDRWLAKWRETDASFGQVNFSVVPASRRFDGVKPSDFEVRSVVPRLKEEVAADIGAAIENLKNVAVDE